MNKDQLLAQLALQEASNNRLRAIVAAIVRRYCEEQIVGNQGIPSTHITMLFVRALEDIPWCTDETMRRHRRDLALCVRGPYEAPLGSFDAPLKAPKISVINALCGVTEAAISQEQSLAVRAFFMAEWNVVHLHFQRFMRKAGVFIAQLLSSPASQQAPFGTATLTAAKGTGGRNTLRFSFDSTPSSSITFSGRPDDQVGASFILTEVKETTFLRALSMIHMVEFYWPEGLDLPDLPTMFSPC